MGVTVGSSEKMLGGKVSLRVLSYHRDITGHEIGIYTGVYP